MRWGLCRVFSLGEGIILERGRDESFGKVYFFTRVLFYSRQRGSVQVIHIMFSLLQPTPCIFERVSRCNDFRRSRIYTLPNMYRSNICTTRQFFFRNTMRGMLVRHHRFQREHFKGVNIHLFRHKDGESKGEKRPLYPYFVSEFHLEGDIWGNPTMDFVSNQHVKRHFFKGATTRDKGRHKGIR